jgi:hypothetical protein
MNVNRLSIQEGSPVYYSKNFMDVMESHLDYLRNSSKSSSFIVDKNIAEVYQGDFFGYLNYRGVQQKYHWIYLRVNGYLSPFDFKPNVDSLIVPSTEEIEQIRSSFINSGLVNF